MSKDEVKHAWLLTATLENWRIAEEKGVFGCHGNSGIIKKLKKGDYFIAFVPRVGFIGHGVVTGEYFVSHIKLWSDKAYNHRFQISTRIISNKVLPAAAIIDDLSFVTNKPRWGVFFRSGIREIPIADHNLLVKKITASADVLSEISENVQRGVERHEIGSELHNRVVKLFGDLGFNILESNYHLAGPDIIVVDPEDRNRSKIIIQCKNSRQVDATFAHLDKHLNEYSGRLRTCGASASILVVANQKLPKKVPGERGELNIEDILNRYGVAVWTSETIEYYEDLINKISRFARYQVLSDLGMRLDFSTKIKTEAIKINQNGHTMYAASLSPDWLLKTVSVIRRVRAIDGPKGYQRLLDKSRVTNSDKSVSISNYIDTNPKWLFPNAIVLASSRNSDLIYDGANLQLRSAYGQFWVIDGQHRLFAFANTSARNSENRLLCIIIDSKSLGSEQYEERELAQIFVTLNGRSKKVPKALLYELYRILGSEDNPQLEVILRLADDKFFTGCIRGYSDKGGSINLVAFADAKGTDSIYRYFKAEYDGQPNEKIIEVATKFILDSFKEVASIFDVEWNDPDKYFLKTDRGVKGMLELLNKVLEKYGSKLDDISKVLKALRDAAFDFSSETAKGLYLGAGGSDQLADEFSKHINKSIIDFAPIFVSNVLEHKQVLRGVIDEDFIKHVLSKLEGDVRCYMNFIDTTTMKYLRFLNVNKVQRLLMFFAKCAVNDEDKIKADLRSLRESGLNVIMTQMNKRTPVGGGVIHERFIGDNKHGFMTDADLKDQSQRNSVINLRLLSWNKPLELDLFDRYWNAAEIEKEVQFGYNWGATDE